MNKKILFIIGASSDFGRELVVRSMNDYDVIVAHYNNSKDELEKLSQSSDGRLYLVKADLMNESEIDAMIHDIKENVGNPTHIVHLPSSKVEYTKFLKSKWDDIQHAVDLQVKSIYTILNAFIPFMSKEKHGRVVFILTSYVCDIYPPKYIMPYITSKYMLYGMMKSLSSEYSDKNITFNAVSPSMTQTKFLNDLPKYIIEQAADTHPLKRLANVSDVVPMIQFLLSDEAGYITGQNILISGGV